jgi:hypothetical protein
MDACEISLRFRDSESRKTPEPGTTCEAENSPEAENENEES